jgi:hypothetical protein
MKGMVLAILALSLAASLNAETSSPPPGNDTFGNQGSPAYTGGFLIYDNGNTDINTDSGNEMTNWRQADDFQLTVTDNATSAEADWFICCGGVWDGTIQWTIYLDSAGSPGAVHASGNGSNIVTTPLGFSQGFDWFNSYWTLGQAVLLNAGTRYWLGLHFSTDCVTRDNVYWAYSVDQNFNVSQEQFSCAGGWTAVTAEDRAFKLFTEEVTPVESATWGAIKSQYME